jgi:hypothetical protein
VSTGEVEIRRPWGGAGVLAPVKVDIDGTQVARLRAGESVCLDVACGEHMIEARLRNTASLPLTVYVEVDGDPLIVEVSPPGPWEILRPGSYKRRKQLLTCMLVELS